MAISHLMGTTGAAALIVSSRHRNVAEESQRMVSSDQEPFACYAPACFEYFFSNESMELPRSICGENLFDGDSDRNVFIYHSSGTTSLPKPIYVSHRQLLSYANCHELAEGREAEGLNLSTLPLYHGFGQMAPNLSLSVGKTLCLPPASTVPNATLTMELLRATKAKSLMTVPSILEDISAASDSAGFELLANLDFVTFGGGPLRAAIGDHLVAKNVTILNHYGSTESGPLSPIFVPKSGYDWHYFRLRKDIKLQIDELRTTEGEKQLKLTAFPLGWEEPFEVQDRLICNPEHPDTDFAAIGRQDDVITLANGEKVTPYLLEDSLSGLELVKAAIVFGDNRFEIGVIVEPAEAIAPEKQEGFRDMVWPTVVEAGRQMDNHAKVSSKKAIIVMPPGATLPRTDKGSIARKQVYSQFKDEIDRVYQILDESGGDKDATQLSFENLEHGLQDIVQSCMVIAVEPGDLGNDDDLFEKGLDSLQALKIRRHTLTAEPSTGGSKWSERIGRDFVYQNPTISQMARALEGHAMTDNSSTSRSCRIEDWVEQFRIKDETPMDNSPHKAVVVITGATGSLGAFTLASLARNPSVASIICLNRPSKDVEQQDAQARQAQSMKAKDLHLSESEWERVRVYQTDCAAPRLGLSDVDYSYLQHSVTHVLHMAWPVDFKMRLPSFQAQFQALHNLLRLCLDAHAVRPRVRPRLLFTSSIATVGRYPTIHGPGLIPETPVENTECTNPIGYAEAKLVCERILERANRDHGGKLDAAYARIGQIAGARTNGAWNTDEHIAALAKSAQHVGALPRLRGTLSWLPVDVVAAAIGELLLVVDAPRAVYHVENPVRQSWGDALDVLAAALGLAGVERLPLDAWLERVRAGADADDAANPAKGLADFFRDDFERMACDGVALGTDAARAVSATLRRVGIVEDVVIRRYIEYWNRVGHLKPCER